MLINQPKFFLEISIVAGSFSFIEYCGIEYFSFMFIFGVGCECRHFGGYKAQNVGG